MSMDMLTLAMAKAYADSQRIGYIEPPRVLTFDGNAEGKEIFEVWVKATEEVIDLNAVEQVVLMNAQNNEEASISKDALWVEENLEDLGPALMYGEGADSTPAIITVLNHIHQGDGSTISKGTYVLCVGDNAWVSKVKISETIHPIDPKFLPGVCLPVVELSTTLTTENTELSAEEKARLNEVAAMGVPIVVNFTLHGTKFGALANASQSQDGNIAMYVYDSTVKIDGETITIEVFGSPTVGKWYASIATGDANG